MNSAAFQFNHDDYAIEMGTGNIFQTILEDYEKLGVVGEDHNKLMCYLAATSRLMDNPLNILVLSSSGAGKSTLQDKTLKLMPPEDVKKLEGKNSGAGRGIGDERYLCDTDAHFGGISDAGISRWMPECFPPRGGRLFHLSDNDQS